MFIRFGAITSVFFAIRDTFRSVETDVITFAAKLDLVIARQTSKALWTNTMLKEFIIIGLVQVINIFKMAMKNS